MANRRRGVDGSRRAFLQRSARGAGLFLVGGTLWHCGGDDGGTTGAGGSGGTGTGGTGGQGGMAGMGGAGGAAPTTSNIANLGPLGDPDANGVRLPAGFTSRIVAASGQPVENSAYTWHAAPDGDAVFPTEDGGWIYVSNAELSGGGGGVGAIRFSAEGEIVDAYSILQGTNRNCAGGPTPWGTWLSCEEVSSGEVFECDPFGVEAGVVRPALGVCSHEAVAVDPVHEMLYLTEDVSDGRLYRFVPDAYPDLTSGTLEAMQVVSGEVGATTWLPVPDPSAANTPMRDQVPESTAFAGGEGIWYHEGVIYFSTKGDDRVWALETTSGDLSIVYDVATSPMPILTGVDNVVVSAGGDVLVAEDGGDLQIVALTPDGQVLPVIQLVGHDGSEITGPAFDPSRQRLYFSSQRGTEGSSSAGITFEVTGPFFV